MSFQPRKQKLETYWKASQTFVKAVEMGEENAFCSEEEKEVKRNLGGRQHGDQ